MGIIDYEYAVCSALFYLIVIARASTTPAMVNEYEYYDCDNM